MTQVIEYARPDVAPDLRRWRAWLQVTGMLLFALGAAAGTIAVWPHDYHWSGRVFHVVPFSGDWCANVLFHASAAVGLAIVGMGMVRAKRWTRPVILTVGMAWVVLAVAGLSILSLTPWVSRSLLPTLVRVSSVVLGPWLAGLLYFLIPIALISFICRQQVGLTLQLYDGKRTWTDSCPLPVLGLSATCAMLAYGLVCFVLPYRSILLFGFELRGLAARAAVGALAFAFASASWQLLKLRRRGWWLAVLLFVLIQAAMVGNVARYDAATIACALGLSRPAVESLGLLKEADLTTISLVTGAVAGGYITCAVYVRRRHFHKAITTSMQSPAAPRPCCGASAARPAR